MNEIDPQRLQLRLLHLAELQSSQNQRFPQGRASPGDFGGLATAIWREGAKVVIAFGESTTWIAFDPDQARYFSDLIRSAADQK